MSEKLGKYKIHQGEILKIGRIVSRIREIRFDKNKNKNNNNINNSKVSNSINCSKNNNYKLKDIDDDILLEKNFKLDLKKQYLEKINDMVNQRNPTDSDLKEKIQIQILNINSNNKNKNVNNNSTQKTLTINTEHKKKDRLCRICYLEEEDEIENPIVQPCHCSGSCKYIHLNCLKQWINTKSCLKVDQNEYCSVFIFTEIECELCKAKLPDLVEHNGKLYSLLDFSDEFPNYLVLESLTLDKENNKFLYLITLDKTDDIKVGRGQFCDILLSDVSVSRIHCLLTIEGKNVYIRDNNSKFGTLILVQCDSIKMTEDLPLNFQVWRTFLKLLIKKNTKFFGCCGVSENPNYLYYHRQNEKEIEKNRFYTVKTEIDKESDGEEKKEKEIEKKINEIKNDDKDKDKDIDKKRNNMETITDEISIENEW